MARRHGDRNRDFEQKRSMLLDALEPRLFRDDGPLITLNEMATTAGVSPSTLRHHLGGRSEVWSAVLERAGARGAPYLALVASPPAEPLEASLRMTLSMIHAGLQRGLLPIVANGIAAGLRDEVVGPSFLNAVLEPILASLEARLAHHQARGEIGPRDLRVAALTLASPLVLAVLHQRGLGGCVVRPLDVDAMIDEQVRMFVSGVATSA